MLLYRRFQYRRLLYRRLQYSWLLYRKLQYRKLQFWRLPYKRFKIQTIQEVTIAIQYICVYSFVYVRSSQMQFIRLSEHLSYCTFVLLTFHDNELHYLKCLCQAQWQVMNGEEQDHKGDIKAVQLPRPSKRVNQGLQINPHYNYR